MPRSAPGPATGTPSSRMRPLLGCSSPATRRSRVDFPQPDRPRMVMKSLSATSRLTGSSAWVGAPPAAPGKVLPTPWIDNRLTRGSLEMAPGEQPAIGLLEQHVRGEPDQADHHDAGDDVLGR